MRNVLMFILLQCLLYPAIGQDIEFPRLSPLPEATVPSKLFLNGKWLFNPTPEADFWKQKDITQWAAIEVPGEWVMQGFTVTPKRAAGYFRTFILPKEWQQKRIKLRCNAVYSDAQVYINGQKAGSHLGGFTPFELDVTQLVSFEKENQIDISVISQSIADKAASASMYAVHDLGGILRDIYVFALPDVSLSMLHASTSFDATYTNATLNIETTIANESSKKSEQLSLCFLLKDAEGKEIPLESSHTISSIEANKTQKMMLSFPIANPRKWDTEHPYLYTLTCQLKEKQRVLHTTSRRIGFRQIEVRGNQMFVNGYPIKLRGVCHHEVMPLRGRSVNNNMWKKDVELFREANVNYIRTSHYPCDEALLEACDELGIFVELEAPFCWAEKASVPEEMHHAVFVNQHMEMVNQNRTHPSILMWSIGNESRLFAENFKEAATIVKQMDPTRPRVFSQYLPGGDDNTLEIGNHHYPGPKKPKGYEKSTRPIVFDEFCHINAYNRLELAADPNLRSHWGNLLDSMWTNMYHNPGILGGAIWAGIDDTFFLPGELPVGYGTWGVIDGWRRQKPEYWGVKKSFSPVKMKQVGAIAEDGTIKFHVENRHDFSNLSECRLLWKANQVSGELKMDMDPHSEGDIELKIPAAARQSPYLEVTVIGVRGFAIDEYKFPLSPQQDYTNILFSEKKELNLKEQDREFVIQIGDQEFRINKQTGLFSAKSKNVPTLLTSPTLMILPLNRNGNGAQMKGTTQDFTPYNPVCTNWIAESVTCLPATDELSVKVKGSYKEAKGTFEYHFHANGKVFLTYDFEMLEDSSPRQVGLVFSLPSSFKQLSWKRKGYWDVYPQNHIDALEGKALAMKSEIPLSGLAGPAEQPTWAWADDQTAAGSNRFRSTKENIYYATLEDARGSAMTVVSNANQHIRAWIEGDSIRLLIADYSNAGSEKFLKSHSQRYYRPMQTGDRLKGTIVWSNKRIIH